MAKFKLFVEFDNMAELTAFVKKSNGVDHPDLPAHMEGVAKVPFPEHIEIIPPPNPQQNEDPEGPKCKADGCGNPADPKSRSGFCSKKCYMRDWFKRHPDATKPKKRPEIANREIG